MGVEKEGISILEISYSIDFLRIIIFTVIFKSKIRKRPYSMQIQMRLYEEDIDMTVIKNGNREVKR